MHGLHVQDSASSRDPYFYLFLTWTGWPVLSNLAPVQRLMCLVSNADSLSSMLLLMSF